MLFDIYLLRMKIEYKSEFDLRIDISMFSTNRNNLGLWVKGITNNQFSYQMVN